MSSYQTYPNARGHARGDENRGCLRTGLVIDTQDTQVAGTAGYPAVVTHEHDGWIRFYIYYVKPEDNGTWWKGPFTGLSEEVEETNS